MNDNLSQRKLCCIPGCDKPSRRTGKYCLKHHSEMMKWLKEATKKVYHYEKLNLCNSKPRIGIRSVYHENSGTILSDLKPTNQFIKDDGTGRQDLL
ncbi:MAG: hypothetical protein SVO01_00045 [Thermotogota bacterium]|nr:hypothetical protein [Thermotogota bacterium]